MYIYFLVPATDFDGSCTKYPSLFIVIGISTLFPYPSLNASKPSVVVPSNSASSTVPAEIECNDCDFHGEAILDDSDHYAPLVKCPKCDSLSVETLNGKDIVVKNIVIEKPEDS